MTERGGNLVVGEAKNSNNLMASLGKNGHGGKVVKQVKKEVGVSKE